MDIFRNPPYCYLPPHEYAEPASPPQRATSPPLIGHLGDMPLRRSSASKGGQPPRTRIDPMRRRHEDSYSGTYRSRPDEEESPPSGRQRTEGYPPPTFHAGHGHSYYGPQPQTWTAEPSSNWTDQRHTEDRWSGPTGRQAQPDEVDHLAGYQIVPPPGYSVRFLPREQASYDDLSDRRDLNHGEAQGIHFFNPERLSDDFYYTREEITNEERAKYRSLESEYSDIFDTSAITEVNRIDRDDLGVVKDVEVRQCRVANVTFDNYDSIGTTGLSTCVAICARGTNEYENVILGISHYDGHLDAASAMRDIHQRMRAAGADGETINYFLVGGLIMPTGMGSLEMEQNLLALSENYNIKGARLHILEGEYNENNEENMLSVVLTPQKVYFSKETLYEAPSSSGSY